MRRHESYTQCKRYSDSLLLSRPSANDRGARFREVLKIEKSKIIINGGAYVIYVLGNPAVVQNKTKTPRKFYTHEGLCCEHNIIYIYRVLHVQQTLASLTIAPTVCLDTYGELKIERIKNARPFINRYPNDLIDGRWRIYMLYIIYVH